MGPEIAWRLRHVWPKGQPDLTDTKLSDVDDDEARRLVNAVEEVKRTFERYFGDEIVPNVPRTPTRVGVVETVRLFTSQHSMNTDYLMMVSGILSGSGGILDLISEQYIFAAAEELGRYSEDSHYEIG
jgi:hypothetical protein